MELRPAYPVVTPRLRLRPLSPNDVHELLAYRSDPEVCRHLPFPPMDEAVLMKRLAADFARTTITGDGQALTLGMELATTGQLIGDVVLFFHSAKHRSGEIGYVLNPAFGGHGYAAEAAAGVLDLAFAPGPGLALHRVTARMVSTNAASVRLASRLGMRQEAHHRSSEMFKGSWIDVLVYAVLAEDWRSGTTGPRDEQYGGKMSVSSALPPFHLAIPVHDIEAARLFYGDVLGFGRGRSAERWTDWNVEGHQVVTHQVDDHRAPIAGTNSVDGHEVPVPHFGLVLEVDRFHDLAQRLTAAGTDFIIEPYLRFQGEPGEQWTMFFLDPSGNALEFKAFRDPTQLFAV